MHKGGKLNVNLKEILSINLRYYRKKYNLSQEKFAEVIGTSLSHLNKMEQQKVDVKLSTIEKYANNLRTFSKEDIYPIDFFSNDKSRITTYNRIDEKK